MIGRKSLIVFLSYCALVSCQLQQGSVKNSFDQPGPGLVRTSLDDLQKKEYASLGFSLIIPVQGDDQNKIYFEDVADSDFFKKNSNTLGSLLLSFHPIFGPHRFSEPVYLIDLSVSRLSQEQFGIFQNGKHYLRIDPFYKVIHPVFSRDMLESKVYDSLNRREYEYLYKTISLENGDILVCLGRVLLLKGEPNLKYDLQQLRRIMNSISGLP